MLESEKMKIRISVRNLVEFVLRSGDIDRRQGGGMQAEAMQRGSRMHRKLQKKGGADYHAEVPLRMEFEQENYTIVLEGRADGIILKRAAQKEHVLVDEIKGVFFDVMQLDEPIGVHLAQAKCYAFIYALQNHLETIGVRMTYVNLDSEELRYFHEEYSFAKLEEWFLGVMEEYKKWAQFQYEWGIVRTASIRQLEFPYEYREGQRELAGDVYKTILRKKNLFIQAPTGTGKTVTTLFPAVKAMGEGLADKIFYLTAKTVTAVVAKETFELFAKHGYRGKTVQIVAREKLCLMDEADCNPESCPYAKGHFDRVNDVVFFLLHKEDLFTRNKLQEEGRAGKVCPFELCLDMAVWCDNIICDYNYVYDPHVCLKRFFAEGVQRNDLFLADEAHNLVERGREMFSAHLYKEDILAARRTVKAMDAKLARELQRCNQLLLEYKRECEGMQYHENISPFVFALMRLAAAMEKFLQKYREFQGRDEVLELYFNVRSFLDVSERLDGHYVIYSELLEDGRFRLRLFCVDPSGCLQERIDKGRSTVFFSGTLLPIHYYKRLLSTQTDNYAVYARSVFQKEQQLVLVGRDVTSRYTQRGKELYGRMAVYIYTVAMQKKGNYLVFCPSYRMMEEVYAEFLAINAEKNESILQKSGMSEAERDEFLLQFTIPRERSLVAFCVMGGIFGEGIDLKEEQLIGAVIIGTGYPQVGNEREVLRRFYEEHSGSGFDYAYRFPGMNKVLQAAGRVIRTASDRGVVLLLDERFLQPEFRALFPREWSDYRICTKEDVAGQLLEFWGKADGTDRKNIKNQ